MKQQDKISASRLNHSYFEKLRVKHSRKKRKSWTVYMILVFVSLLLWYKYHTAIGSIGVISIYSIVNLNIINVLFSIDWIIIIILNIFRNINILKFTFQAKRYLYKIYKYISILNIGYIIRSYDKDNNHYNKKQGNEEETSMKTNNLITNNQRIQLVSPIIGNTNNNNNSINDNNYNNPITDLVLNDDEMFYEISDNNIIHYCGPINNNHSTSYQDINHKNNKVFNKTKEDTITHIDKTFSYYIETLLKHNLTIIPLIGDGNCLFRAFAHQIYGNEDLHSIVRQKCMDYMELNAIFYSHFIADLTFIDYIIERRREGVWGDHLEIKAISDLYNCNVEIWDCDPIEGAKLRTSLYDVNNNNNNNQQLVRNKVDDNNLLLLQSVQNLQEEDKQQKFVKIKVRLSYYGNNHYNSLVLCTTNS